MPHDDLVFCSPLGAWHADLVDVIMSWLMERSFNFWFEPLPTLVYFIAGGLLLDGLVQFRPRPPGT